jgi:2-polyprenyl-3-methyl-5-hydroxy-6-metoxy-1,4-benzoquinol methylase
MLANPFAIDLKNRRQQPELMDEPGLDMSRHFAALRGLERLNLWSGSVRNLWRTIRTLPEDQRAEPLRILDIASGAGDGAIGLWRKAVRAGYRLEIDAWDVSLSAVEYARHRAKRSGAGVKFHRIDALETAIPPHYDVIVSSLFLHHLSADQALQLLLRMAQGVRRMVLINDLRRCRWGFWLAWFATRLLTNSRIVHVDGPRSIEGANSMEEASDLAEKAGLHGSTVDCRWPCLFLLTWKRL